MTKNIAHDGRTIDELAAALRRRELSCATLTERCLALVDRLEAQTHAWVLVDREGARHTAAERDRQLSEGKDLGPLHGIPLGIKDLFDVAGWPTRAGSPLSDPAPATHDCPVIARLRAAGAVILGKTVTTEWASFDPPPTVNPWNAAHTPGGSSSGSSAATSLGMCVAAIGSQTGGSITRPAIYCGVAGCKPTWSRVSLRGAVPLSPHMDHPGPIARRVSDLAALLQAIAGYDAADPWSSDRPVDNYRAELGRKAPPRIGWVREFFAEAADAATNRATADAIERLREAGATIVDAPLPACFSQVVAWHRTIMSVEAATAHRNIFPARREQFGRQLAQLLDEGLAKSPLDFAEALAGRLTWQRAVLEMLSGVDCLLTPAATSAAPPRLDMTGDPRFNSPWSMSAAPTVSFPTALSPEGMPLGLQLIGRPWHEAALLGAAAWCERVLEFDAWPPPVA